MKQPPLPLYDFGEFRLDPKNHLLSRRDGTPVPLTPRVFDTLLFMVEHHGTVLDKERLMEAVWPDSLVEENNLTQNISTLRRVFGDTPGSHRFIATVPGRGYRFVPEVLTPVANPDPPESPAISAEPAASSEGPLDGPKTEDEEAIFAEGPVRPLWVRSPLLWVAFTFLAVAMAAFIFWQVRPQTPASRPRASESISEKSIAVLPFANLSGDPENAYFAEGIKDEILTRLSKIAALKVISRTSTEKFKGSPENVREIARQLGVANILEGSVQKSGETARVTVQLINTHTDTHLWAETYDRKLTAMFEVESEVAQRIATALEATLSGPKEQSLRAKPIANTEAYQAYLKGRYFWDKRTSGGLTKAGEYFEQAIAIDSNYAPAYAGLSDVYQFAAYEAVTRTDLYAKAREAAKKALALDESLAEPHTSLGLLAMNYDWDWAAAEIEFKRAIQLNPNYATAHHWYAEYLAAVGRPEESLAEIRRARELDPLSLIINTDTGKLLYYARRYDEAIGQLRETLAMDPEFAQAHVWLGSVYATTGAYEAAISEFEKIKENSWAAGWLGYVYGVSGEREKAGKVLAELLAAGSGHPPDPHVLLCVYLGIGDKDQAFAALEREYAVRSVGMTSLKVNPWYDSLRSEPRFADLLRRTKLAP